MVQCLGAIFFWKYLPKTEKFSIFGYFWQNSQLFIFIIEILRYEWQESMMDSSLIFRKLFAIFFRLTNVKCLILQYVVNCCLQKLKCFIPENFSCRPSLKYTNENFFVHTCCSIFFTLMNSKLNNYYWCCTLKYDHDPFRPSTHKDKRQCDHIGFLWRWTQLNQSQKFKAK
jgi:hypothetical protein